MIRSFPLLARLSVFVAIPIALVLGLTLYQFRASLPPDGAGLVVSGVQAPVQIIRDEQGVPRIVAQSEHDLFFGIGYAHAQDRLWQLERQRRIAQGRLSEVFGKATVKQDSWFRTLGLYEAAKASLPALSQRARDSLDAYAEGINAWVASHDKLPPEFEMLGIRPQPWTAADSLAWIKVFSLNLSENFGEEIERHIASQALSPAELDTFFKRENADSPAASPDTARPAQRGALLKLLDLKRTLASELQIGGQWLGSNAWVVSPRHSGNGMAVLANDPHLALSMPSWWYAAVLDGPRLKSAGMTLVGLPIIMLGRNQHIAWGATSMTADVQDLYLEEVNPANPREYRVRDRWEAMTVRKEVVTVRADFPSSLRPEVKPVELRVRATRHGPVVSDFENPLGQVVSLRWVALEGSDTTYEGLFKLNFASDWPSFRQALADVVSPALNFLYADVEGNIGYAGAGRVPLRGKGKGALPVGGADGEHEWDGYIPSDRMPSSFNPASGYIVSANQRMFDGTYPYFISNSWAPPARAQRITAMLDGFISQKGRLSLEDHQRIQTDVVSEPALGFVRALPELAGTTDRQKAALKLLREWKGSMAPTLVAPSIVNVWTRHLKRRLFSDRLQLPWNARAQSGYMDAMLDRLPTESLTQALAADKGTWCETADRQSTRACQRAILLSLDDALDELTKLAGSDMDSWTWGSIHRALYEHIPFSFTRPLDKIFERRAATGGSTDTVNVAYSQFRSSEGYVKTSGAGVRQIIEMGAAPGAYLYINSTGQSGNVLSRHYADMIDPFENGTYFRLDHAGMGAPSVSPQGSAASQPATPK